MAIASTYRDHFRKRTLLASYFAESVFSQKSSDYFKDLSKHKEGKIINEVITFIRMYFEKGPTSFNQNPAKIDIYLIKH